MDVFHCISGASASEFLTRGKRCGRELAVLFGVCRLRPNCVDHEGVRRLARAFDDFRNAFFQLRRKFKSGCHS